MTSGWCMFYLVSCFGFTVRWSSGWNCTIYLSGVGSKILFYLLKLNLRGEIWYCLKTPLCRQTILLLVGLFSSEAWWKEIGCLHLVLWIKSWTFYGETRINKCLDWKVPNTCKCLLWNRIFMPCERIFLCRLQLLLECPDDILAFEFCPSNPNILVGGCINGQVLILNLLHMHLLSFLPYSSFFLNLTFKTTTKKIHNYWNTRMLPNVVSVLNQYFIFVLLLFQVVLWDISAHVTHLQESGKKLSVNRDTFVSTRILCTMLIW